MNNTAKKKACAQFLQAAAQGENSQFIPRENLTPYTLYNIDDSTKDILLRAIHSIPKESLLLIVLGESEDLVAKILDTHHAALEQEFVTTFEGPISILVIDPEIKTSEGQESIEYPIEDSLKAHRVMRFTGVKAKFPLTPLYGPHKHMDQFYVMKQYGATPRNVLHYKLNKELFDPIEQIRKMKLSQGMFASRRLIHENALTVLNTLVEHPSPLFISSRITSVCYRSFKYLIDVRAKFGRKTLVRYEYTVPKYGPVNQCVSAEEFSLFPNPFTKCMSNMNDDMLNQYYFNEKRGKPNRSNERRVTLRNKIKEVNEWTDRELAKRIPKGGKRAKKMRTRKH